ncbi:MAG: hypothetical protein AAB568_01225 [Patescibacteria group bacterium]
MNEVRKFYRGEVLRILNKIERREMWLRSDEANKTDILSGFNRRAVKQEILLLKRDLVEAKKILKRYAKG